MGEFDFHVWGPEASLDRSGHPLQLVKAENHEAGNIQNPPKTIESSFQFKMHKKLHDLFSLEKKRRQLGVGLGFTISNFNF